MVGDAVRDKDAVASTLLVCEIASQTKNAGSSIYKELLNLYLDYGFYKEDLISITKKGMEGANQIAQMMRNLRENIPLEIVGQRVVIVEDYQSSVTKSLVDDQEYTISIPKSNVLIYYLEDGSKICVRPSGTEPKIKFYFSVNSYLENIENKKETERYLDKKIADYKDWVKKNV